MSIDLLDHVSIRTVDVEATRRFYTEILGFEDGARPPFSFPGAWLYQSGRPVIHVIGIDRDKPGGLTDYLGAREAAGGTGSIDHIAFTAHDIAGLKAHLQQHDIPFRERTVPALNLEQLFVEDPNGVIIELNFPH